MNSTIPIDFETDVIAASTTTLTLYSTQVNPYCRPGDLGGKRIGGVWMKDHYKKIFGGGFDARPRAVALGVSLGSEVGKRWAFHLSAMSSEDVARLVKLVTKGKVVVGFDLAPLLTWLMHISGDSIETLQTRDVMLISRCIYPEAHWWVHTRAAKDGIEAEVMAARALIAAADGDAPGNIDTLALALTGRMPKPEWQGFHHWYPTNLSEAHTAHVLSMSDVPNQILKAMFDAYPDRDWKLHDSIWERMPVVLARIARRGIPINSERASRIQIDRIQSLQGLVDRLIKKAPELVPWADTLRSGSTQIPEGLKSALSLYVSRVGCALPVGTNGQPIIGADAAAMTGANKVSGWDDWMKIQIAKMAARFCGDYRNAVAPDGCIHPTISPTTVTMRMTSLSPNALSMPRQQADLNSDLQVRSIVEARPGWKIISADFGQIDLRVASALAIKAIEAARLALATGKGAPKWILDALGGSPSRGFEAAEGLSKAWIGVQAMGTPMADAFRRGMDPHAITGARMASRRQGGESRTDDRQAAKAVNFGLLYGLSAESLWRRGIKKYGLDWTLDDAKLARAEWFDMYPDLDFWQRWTHSVQVDSEETKLFKRDKYSRVKSVLMLKMRHSETLLGKQVVTPSRYEQLNHADQGSGAEILAIAVLKMGIAANYIVNLVHDEVVAHAPESIAEDVAEDIKRSMISAASESLGQFNVPATAEVCIADCWS